MGSSCQDPELPANTCTRAEAPPNATQSATHLHGLAEQANESRAVCMRKAQKDRHASKTALPARSSIRDLGCPTADDQLLCFLRNQLLCWETLICNFSIWLFTDPGARGRSPAPKQKSLKLINKGWVWLGTSLTPSTQEAEAGPTL